MSPGLDGALPKNGYSFPGSFSSLSDGACGIALTSSAYGGQWSNEASSRCAYNGFLPGSSDMSLVENCVEAVVIVWFFLLGFHLGMLSRCARGFAPLMVRNMKVCWMRVRLALVVLGIFLMWNS